MEVSVVMPVFNAAATIEDAVQSIRQQTFRDWELIVIDDGSTDGTPDILADCAELDRRVQPVFTQHFGIVSALTTGVELGRGEFIARMDADDISHPDRFAEQLSFLGQHVDMGLVGSLVEFGGDRATSEGYALHVDWMNTIATPQQIALNRFIESPFAHPSVMFRRELIARYGGYRQGSFPEDYELWLRWMSAGVKMSKVPHTLLRWNDASERLSRKDLRYSTDAFYRCKANYLATWLQANVASNRPIIVWGVGRPTRKRADYLLEHRVDIRAYIDIDPEKQGRSLSERPVLSPSEIPGDAFVLVYVANRGARELIRAQLQSLGRIEGQDFLMAA